MGIADRRNRFLTNDATVLNETIAESREGFKVWLVLPRLFFCFSVIFFVSFYVMSDFAIAGTTAQEIKAEVKEGVRETKEEFKKMPEELKKAGQEAKKKAEEVKKDIEADVEEGKKNVRSLTK
jgi:ElaB/YqjD/DUF883 family membrane-anchored ribosome-binding protein